MGWYNHRILSKNVLKPCLLWFGAISKLIWSNGKEKEIVEDDFASATTFGSPPWDIWLWSTYLAPLPGTCFSGKNENRVWLFLSASADFLWLPIPFWSKKRRLPTFRHHPTRIHPFLKQNQVNIKQISTPSDRLQNHQEVKKPPLCCKMSGFGARSTKIWEAQFFTLGKQQEP